MNAESSETLIDSAFFVFSAFGLVYREKASGMQELNWLRLKAQFVSSNNRTLYYLLASKSGFTEELLALRDPHVILIHQVS